MKIVKINVYGAQSPVFVPCDGRVYDKFRVRSQSDGTYQLRVRSSRFKYNEAGRSNFDKTREWVVEYYTIAEGDTIEGEYFFTRWDYNYGGINCYADFTACVCAVWDVIDEISDPIMRGRLLLLLGKYEEGEQVLSDVVMKYDTEYDYTLGLKLEEGLGVPKNPDLAYRYYLKAGECDAVLRFLNMGYGEGVVSPEILALDFETYEARTLLCELLRYALGEEDALSSLVKLGLSFDYEAEKKESEEAFDKMSRYARALCQREAVKRILDGRKEEYRDKVLLLLGAYYAYEELSHNGDIAYIENVNIGDEYDSDWVKKEMTNLTLARTYVEAHATQGDTLAKAALTFVDFESTDA